MRHVTVPETPRAAADLAGCLHRDAVRHDGSRGSAHRGDGSRGQRGKIAEVAE